MADDLYVADWASGLSHQVVAAGVKPNPTRIVAAGLQHPEGMALDIHGKLLVVETSWPRPTGPMRELAR